MALADLNFMAGGHRIQMADARMRGDAAMRALLDELDDAYYGTPTGNTRAQDGWKHGVSHPFYSWDYEVSEDNQLKFNLLSGYFHHMTSLVQHAFNCDHRGVSNDPDSQYDKYPEQKYNVAADGVATKVSQSKAWMRAMADTWNAAGLTPTWNRGRVVSILARVKRGNVAVLLARRTDLDGILDPDVTDDIST